MRKSILLLTVLALCCATLKTNAAEKIETISGQLDYKLELYSDRTAKVVGFDPSVVEYDEVPGTNMKTNYRITKTLRMPAHFFYPGNNPNYKGQTFTVTSVDLPCYDYVISSITISGTVSNVKLSGSFEGKTTLGSLTLPKSVKYLRLGDGQSYVKILEAINVDDLSTWCNMELWFWAAQNPFYWGAKLYVKGVEVKGEMTIPSGVTKIRDYCFNGYKGITSVKFPSTITSIGYYAFAGSGLTSVEIPNTISSLGAAFVGCTALKSVKLPNSLTSLEETFRDCSSLTSIDIPTSVTHLGALTFYGTRLTQVYIPTTVKEMEGWVFPTTLNKVYVDDLDAFSRIDTYADEGMRHSDPFSAPYTLICGKPVTEITIPDDMTRISDVYIDILGIEKVNLPASITDYGAAFRKSPVRQIRNNSNNPGNIQYIPLTDWAARSRGTGDESAIAFEETDKTTCVVVVPYGCVDTYKSTDGWKDFTNIKDNSFVDANGYTYVLYDDGTAMIVAAPSVYDLEGEVVIPSEVTDNGKTYKVTSIGEEAFLGRRYITSVTIPSTIESIGDNAFEGCYNSGDGQGLKTVVFSGESKLKIIGKNAFSSCCALESISIPSSVTKIGEGAFIYCYKLASVNIPEGVDKIEKETFMSCESLTTVTIPASVDSIMGHAFGKCEKLKPLKLPVGDLVYIGEGAFSGCDALEKVVIPEGVTMIDTEAFRGCENLRSVTIPSTIKLIEHEIDGTITYATGFESFEDDPLTEIITYIKNPQHPQYRNSFYFPANGPKLYVPRGSKAAYYKYWANEYDYPEIIEMGDAAGGIAFANDAVREICISNWDTNHDGSLSEEEAAAVTKIGEEFKANKDITSFNELQYFTGLTEIADNAFYNCEKLTSIKLPATVKKIGEGAFVGCSALTIFDFASNTDMTDFQMESGVFIGCTSLKNFTVDGNTNGVIRKLSNYQDFSVVDGVLYVRQIKYSVRNDGRFMTHGDEEPFLLYAYPGNHGDTYTVPESVVEINDYSFSLSGIKEVTLPARLRYLGEYAFGYCNNLTKVTANATIPCVAEKAFEGSTAAALYIPSAGMKELYQTEAGWKELSSIVTGSGQTTVFANDTRELFYKVLDGQSVALMAIDSKTGGKVTVPATVTHGSNTYNVTYIGSGEEDWSSSFFNEVKHHDFPVFDMRYEDDTPLVTEVEIPNTVKSIGSYALHRTKRSNLVKVVIPSSVEEIGESAFGENTIKELKLNKGLKTIGELAFRLSKGESEGMGDLVIPEGVERIESAAFIMRNLNSVTIPASVISIGQNNFRKYDNPQEQNLQDLRVNISDLNAFCRIMTRDGWFAQNYRLYQNGTEIKEVALPEGMERIDEVFSCCMSLEKVTLPSSALYVGGEAFFMCKNLKTVINLSQTPQTVYRYGQGAINATRAMSRADSDTSDDPFNNVDKAACTVYVPQGSVDTYKSADCWKGFTNIKDLISGDANGDGVTDVLDLIAVARYILKLPVSNDFDTVCSDVTFDWQIDVLDLINIARGIIGNSLPKARAMDMEIEVNPE